MARKKTRADEVHNLRRRLKTRIKRADREGRRAESESLREILFNTYARRTAGQPRGRKTLDNVREQIENARKALSNSRKKEKLMDSLKKRGESVKKKKETRDFGKPEPLKKDKRRAEDTAARDLSQELTEKTQKFAQYKTISEFRADRQIDDVTRQRMEIDLASLSPSKLSNTQRARLYGATRADWAGVPYDKREQVILSKYGAKNEEELWGFLTARLDEYVDGETIAQMGTDERYNAIVASL